MQPSRELVDVGLDSIPNLGESKRWLKYYESIFQDLRSTEVKKSYFSQKKVLSGEYTDETYSVVNIVSEARIAPFGIGKCLYLDVNQHTEGSLSTKAAYRVAWNASGLVVQSLSSFKSNVGESSSSDCTGNYINGDYIGHPSWKGSEIDFCSMTNYRLAVAGEELGRMLKLTQDSA